MEAAGTRLSGRDRLKARYTDYICCLNERRWSDLGAYVDAQAVHNGRPFGLNGYRAMLEENVAQIPDLTFNVTRLLVDEEQASVAAIIHFECTPTADIFETRVNGRTIRFEENVFYRLSSELKIVEVKSIIDIAAIREQAQA
ncbi:Polyketide cyclase SnoaL-like domain [Ceraceosorus bombacis]|uniref:Polyketide cyclase SnoaL-like domain n=1 Tax=Ceraceosorus bombacis TaxID=401625 RepID=A0A0P1BMP0_9BASI|nr:Polyketide cyclase SnoaL-like domain [Ceraceosorus bombacis]